MRVKSHLGIGIVNMDMDATRQCTYNMSNMV